MSRSANSTTARKQIWANKVFPQFKYTRTHFQTKLDSLWLHEADVHKNPAEHS